MRTLQSELQAVLTSKVVEAAAKEVVRVSIPERRLFDRTVRIMTPGSLDRLRYLCEVARDKPTEAKVQTAKLALLEAIGKHTRPGFTSSQVTSEQWTLASNVFYGLYLNEPGWSTAEQVYDTCLELHKADNWANQVKPW